MKLLRFVSLCEKRKDRKDSRRARSLGVIQNQNSNGETEEVVEPTICILGEEQDIRLKIVDIVPDQHKDGTTTEEETPTTTATTPTTPNEISPAVDVTRVPSKTTQQKLFMQNLLQLSQHHIDAMGEPVAPTMQTDTASTAVVSHAASTDNNNGDHVTVTKTVELKSAATSIGDAADATSKEESNNNNKAQKEKTQEKEAPSVGVDDWSNFLGQCSCEVFELFGDDVDDDDDDNQANTKAATAAAKQTPPVVVPPPQVEEPIMDDESVSIPSALKDIPIKRRFLTRTLESMSVPIRRVEYDDTFVADFNEQMAELKTDGSSVSDLKSTLTMSRLNSLADDDSMFERLRQAHLAMKEEERDEISTVAH